MTQTLNNNVLRVLGFTEICEWKSFGEAVFSNNRLFKGVYISIKTNLTHYDKIWMKQKGNKERFNQITKDCAFACYKGKMRACGNIKIQARKKMRAEDLPREQHKMQSGAPKTVKLNQTIVCHFLMLNVVPDSSGLLTILY